MNEQGNAGIEGQYKHLLDSFLLNLHSLKSFANNLRPVLLNDVIRKKESKIEERDVELLLEMLKILKFGTMDLDVDQEVKDKKTAYLEKLLDEKHGVKLLNKTDISIHGLAGVATKKALKDYRSRQKQLSILYQSTLISMVIYFEMFVASIIKHRLVRYPKAADIEYKTLTFDDIRKLGSFENAEQYLIEQVIETLLRDKYLEWINYIKTNMKLKLDRISPLNDKVIEIIQRRNLFVHNEGIANNIYLNNINSEFKSEVMLGEKLEITPEYIDKSISTIRHVGVLIGLEYWRMMEKESDERVSYIGDIGMELMLSQEWELAKDIYQFNLLEKSIDSISKTVSQINYWLSLKRLGNFNEVKNEVESSDFFDKTRDFQVCYAALVGDTERMYNEIPKAIKTEELTVEALMSWPIFTEYRNDEKFVALLDHEEENIEENISIEA
ncbi:hypothetical protein [Paenibacillus sp. FSL R7-0337]|uniref:hypothetical protein n=1 Tax=Paenibacillus sp. FSL R7-0337 TaxID=1926588 RepID=UPI00096D4FBD|nr:hypothetical protein [Paenibacillus sp. FSL R7-0337]OMG00425.1 hypothetical protein BK147_04270 [Paenibacillus sp. FSL R7-0337]